MNSSLHVLLVDDDRRMTRTLADILAVHGHQAAQAASGAEALRLIQEKAFDCVLTDISMPGMSGADLVRQIRDVQPGLPVLFMTAYASDETIRQGLEDGAVAVLEKPLDLHYLLNFLAALGEEKVVTILDDDPGFCQTLADILEQRGFRVTRFSDPHTLLETILERTQILLLDMKLNSVSGRDLLEALRRTHPGLPVILITGYRQEMAIPIEQALALNACICLYKPLVIPDLLAKLTEIRRARLKELWREAASGANHARQP